MAELFQVLVGDAKNAVQVLEAPEKDARAYLENNFPRVHIQPGANVPPKVDAFLRGPDGTEEHFHGPEAGWKTPDDTKALTPGASTVSSDDAEEYQKFIAWRTEQRNIAAHQKEKEAAELAAFQAAHADEPSVETE